MLIRFCLALGLLISTVHAAQLKDFSDQQLIPTWAKVSFEALLKADVISGTGNKELKPNTTINRAEFLKILIEATDQTLVTPINPSFSDVSPAQWFYPYVETAAALDWASGYPDGSFRPGNTINRAEIAKLINRAFKVQVTPTGSEKNWYDSHVKALSVNNLLPYNVGENAFNAARAPSRAEAFEQIYRALQFKYTGVSAPTNATRVVEDPTQEFDTAANFGLTMAVTPSAGRLDLKRPDSQAQKVPVTPGQTNVTIAKLETVARGGNVTLSDLQFRRIGNGSITDFSQLWLEVNNQPITAKTTPNNDLVAFNFNAPLNLQSNRITVINLKADISNNAKVGNSERFVLYLPDWINANTNEKIGLFPLGGSDVEVR